MSCGVSVIHTAGSHAAVFMQVLDDPALAVADNIPSISQQIIVIALAKDDIADKPLMATRKPDMMTQWVNSPGIPTDLLGKAVKQIHILPGTSHQQRLQALVLVFRPTGEGVHEHGRRGSCMQTVVIGIPLGSTNSVGFVTVTQQLRR